MPTTQKENHYLTAEELTRLRRHAEVCWGTTPRPWTPALDPGLQHPHDRS